MYCRQCGSYIPAGVGRCPRCGVTVEPQRVVSFDDDYTTHVSAPHSTYPPPPSRRSWPLVVGIVLGTLLASAVFIVGLLLYNNLPMQAGKPEGTPRATPAPTQPPAPTPERTQPPRRQPTPQATTDYNGSQPNYNSYQPNANAAAPPVTPTSVVLVRGTFIVENLQTRYFTFSVPSGSTGVVEGNFSAQGGGNDINVMVMTAGDYARFSSLNGFSTYFNSGYSTARSFQVRIPPGDYTLVFNNRRSVLTSKAVSAYVQLRLE